MGGTGFQLWTEVITGMKDTEQGIQAVMLQQCRMVTDGSQTDGELASSYRVTHGVSTMYRKKISQLQTYKHNSTFQAINNFPSGKK